jgi:hypothetical protein
MADGPISDNRSEKQIANNETPDASTLGFDIEKQANPNDNDAISGTTLEKEEPVDPNIVNWDGPNDPANPMNWTKSTKIAAMAIVSLNTLLS